MAILNKRSGGSGMMVRAADRFGMKRSLGGPIVSKKDQAS